MTLQEFYDSIGGDYASMANRISRETTLRRLLKVFLADENMALLLSALDADDTVTAFRAAHTLKGVAMNMSFSRLSSSASAITELLRAGDIAAAKNNIRAVKCDYNAVVSAIKGLE